MKSIKRKIITGCCFFALLTAFTACGSQQAEEIIEETTTEATTEKATEATTEKATEATTEKATEATTEKVTEATTEAPLKEANYRDVFSSDEIVAVLLPPNSADGIQMMWVEKYIGSKTINYITFCFEMLNPVGDPAYDEITKESKVVVRYVGPIESGEYVSCFSKDEPVAYCGVCQKIALDSVLLEYSDGTVDYIDYKFLGEAREIKQLDVTWGILGNQILKEARPGIYEEYSHMWFN